MARTASNLSIEFEAEADYSHHEKENRSGYVRIVRRIPVEFVNVLLKLVCKHFSLASRGKYDVILISRTMQTGRKKQ